MKPGGTLVLTRRDVAALVSIEECLAAVERVFKLYGEGRTQRPGVLGLRSSDGAFHIKAGMLELKRAYFATKVNANFPENTRRFGLPMIQGVIILSDAENGYPLAVMDSIEITIQRTGAATAIAAKYLARPNSASVTICGCGNQGRISLRALAKLFSLARVSAYDRDVARAEEFAKEFSKELAIAVEAVPRLEQAVRQSDIWVTCTPATQYFLKPEHLAPGAFVAAVGADSEEKQELDPALLGQGKVVVDVLEQCAAIGELHHALAHDILTPDDVHAELGEVVAGTKPGRSSAEEIIIFDSTGMALQDVVTAAAVYEKAISIGVGVRMNLVD